MIAFLICAPVAASFFYVGFAMWRRRAQKRRVMGDLVEVPPARWRR